MHSHSFNVDIHNTHRRHLQIFQAFEHTHKHVYSHTNTHLLNVRIPQVNIRSSDDVCGLRRQFEYEFCIHFWIPVLYEQRVVKIRSILVLGVILAEIVYANHPYFLVYPVKWIHIYIAIIIEVSGDKLSHMSSLRIIEYLRYS